MLELNRQKREKTYTFSSSNFPVVAMESIWVCKKSGMLSMTLISDAFGEKKRLIRN